MPHPQQAAMMSQLPSNRQTVVPPTQPAFYIVPQAQVTPQAPAVAGTFQPTQYGMKSFVIKTLWLCVLNVWLKKNNFVRKLDFHKNHKVFHLGNI